MVSRMYPPPVTHRAGGNVPAGTTNKAAGDTATAAGMSDNSDRGLSSPRDRTEGNGPTAVDALPEIDLPLSFSVETASTTSQQPKPLSLDSRPPSFESHLAGVDRFAPDKPSDSGHKSPFGYVAPALDEPSADQASVDQTLTLNRIDARADTGILGEVNASETNGKPLSPRFEFAADFERPQHRSLTRRMVQGGLLVAAVAAVAGFIVMMPDDESTSAEAAQAATQIRTEDNPTASAELLTSADSPSVEGQLGDTGELARITPFSAAGVGTPADTGEGFDLAVDAAITDDDDTEPTTSTTAWVEPTLPPESEWIDSGNGVMVPDLLLRIRFCESTNNYTAANDHSTARGAYQFLTGSWDWYGHAAQTGVAQAHLATPAQQDQAALRTLQSEGTGPWTASRRCWSDPNIPSNYATAKPAPTTTPTTVDETTTTVEGGETTTTVDDGETTTTTVDEGETTTTTVDDGETTTTVDDSTTTTVDEGETTTTTTDDGSSTTAP